MLIKISTSYLIYGKHIVVFISSHGLKFSIIQFIDSGGQTGVWREWEGWGCYIPLPYDVRRNFPKFKKWNHYFNFIFLVIW